MWSVSFVVSTCAETNECAQSFLGDDAAVGAPSSDEERAVTFDFHTGEHADERVLLLDVRAALAARDVSGERPALARAVDAARQGIEQSGLAATRGPEDAADLPAANGARAVVEDGLLPIGFVRYFERETLPAHLPARRLFYVDSAVRHCLLA